MIKDDVLITPAIESGCFEDTIRKPLLDVATQLNIKSMELTNIKKDMIPEMKELFFASEKNGIQWILGVENKRFFPNISKRIHESLNKYLKEKVS
jgi:branched-chain amino acid aminotransferase